MMSALLAVEAAAVPVSGVAAAITLEEQSAEEVKESAVVWTTVSALTTMVEVLMVAATGEMEVMERAVTAAVVTGVAVMAAAVTTAVVAAVVAAVMVTAVSTAALAAEVVTVETVMAAVVTQVAVTAAVTAAAVAMTAVTTMLGVAVVISLSPMHFMDLHKPCLGEGCILSILMYIAYPKRLMKFAPLLTLLILLCFAALKPG